MKSRFSSPKANSYRLITIPHSLPADSGEAGARLPPRGARRDLVSTGLRHILPNGEVGDYFYVHTNGSSLIIPILDDGRIVMVTQYRYLCDEESLEFPSGGVKAGGYYLYTDKGPSMKRPSSALLVVLVTLFYATANTQVKTGADLLFEKYLHLIEGKKVGLVTNHSALLSNGKHLADALFEDRRTKLVALFGPEHGIRGDAPAGKAITDGVDAKTGVRAYSLYGASYKPTDEMLKGVDVLMYDLQDVGVRFYTYISTLSYAMEAAAEHNIPFIVLDRPNPIRGVWVEGFLREDSLRSFVGLHPIPVAHGMTIGELAAMYNNEGWLKNGVKASLTVIKMEAWKRTMWYDQTGLKIWVKPSPNLPTLESATVYPGTCFFEGVNISEGRGTDRPFENIGAPYIDGVRWARALNDCKLKGVEFEAVEFTPRSIEGAAMHPKYEGVKCGGVLVKITDRETLEPVKVGVFMLSTAKKLFGDSLTWRERSIDRLAGTPKLRASIDAGVPPEKIAAMWKEGVEKFKKVRAKHLLY